jgi:hypothetical protein
VLGTKRVSCCACCCHQAEAFAVSDRDRTVKAYALAVADAINNGGDQVTKAYAQAFASACAGRHTDVAVSQGSHIMSFTPDTCSACLAPSKAALPVSAA